MFNRFLCVSMVAAAIIARPAALSAQQWPPPPPPAKNMDRLPRTEIIKPEVEERTPAQTAPAQNLEQAQEPAPPAPPVVAPKRNVSKHAAKHPHKPAAHAVVCSGAFAKASNQVKLESTYESENVTFTQVDGPDRTKVNATVLFQNNPKQRLEIWWADEANRNGIYLIVINGRSAWTAPRGVKLGLSLAALEKINHKPFKLKGLDKDDGSQVSDWNGGALSHLPGQCKMGVRLRPDAKASAKFREAATNDKEFVSSDAIIRAVRPTVAEIILGY
jgi:hypothetical protein